MNAANTQSWPTRIGPRASTTALSRPATPNSPAGIGSGAPLVSSYPSNAFPSGTAARTPLAGWTEPIRRWGMGWWSGGCVSTGRTAVASSRRTSGSVTVAPSTCTSWSRCPLVTWDTALWRRSRVSDITPSRAMFCNILSDRILA